MINKEIEILLYTEEDIDFGDYFVNTFFDDQTLEKCIDVIVTLSIKNWYF